MTRIHFLHGARDRYQAAVAWLAQRSQSGLSALVYLNGVEDQTLLDRLLWTQSALGFTPHCHLGDQLQKETPIVLATDIENIPQNNCLVNLSNAIPPGFERFDELVEIISIDDNDRLPGRDRFRFYREHGHDLQNIDISRGLPA